MRRVVTGNDAQGKAVFVSDGESEKIELGADIPPVELVWGWDAIPAVPTDGAKPDYRRYFPPDGALRVIVVSMPPDDQPVELDPQVAEESFVGLYTDADWDPENPGMHTTASIDIGLVLSGKVLLELDDGEQRLLEPGDWYIQNGTRHAWRNPYDEPCRVAIFLAGTSSTKHLV
jgi:hypothetical protein